MELRYDLPEGATKEEREREWMLPARILYSKEGPPRRLDRVEAEARLTAWLKGAKLERSACGRWLFTWNAFQIVCDPDAVISKVKNFQLRFLPARERALLEDPSATAPATLRRDGRSLAADFVVDAEKLRRQQAEADVAVGEITGEPVTLEQALVKLASTRIAGTISVRLDLAADGRVERRTRLVSLRVEDASGKTTTSDQKQVTEIVAVR